MDFVRILTYSFHSKILNDISASMACVTVGRKTYLKWSPKGVPAHGSLAEGSLWLLMRQVCIHQGITRFSSVSLTGSSFRGRKPGNVSQVSHVEKRKCNRVKSKVDPLMKRNLKIWGASNCLFDPFSGKYQKTNHVGCCKIIAGFKASLSPAPSRWASLVHLALVSWEISVDMNCPMENRNQGCRLFRCIEQIIETFEGTKTLY